MHQGLNAEDTSKHIFIDVFVKMQLDAFRTFVQELTQE
jgi:hypothetical protein